ncbi:MAG TPA: PDZ domain-containing protein [Acidimicrobiales bacterium]|nr:PDZ domain-containing protein [Acidimicrobiales bacterium]
MVGTAGAVLIGAGVLALGLGEGVGDRSGVERVALDPVSTSPAAADDATLGAVRQRVAPAVVTVDSAWTEAGSGVLVREDGIVLTSASLLGKGGPGTVGLPDGEAAAAEVVGVDPVTGLGVLDLAGDGYPTAALSPQAQLIEGEAAFTVSSGLTGGGTAVAALVGTTRRYLTPQGDTLDAVVETTGSAPARAVGAPLVTPEGEVAGIVAAVEEGSGTYVVPAEIAHKVSDDLLAQGAVEHCWLGIEGSSATNGGVTVATVEADSPAERGGLRPGDVLVTFDGRTIADVPDLMVALRSHSPGQRIDVAVERDDSRATVAITLGTLPDGD